MRNNPDQQKKERFRLRIWGLSRILRWIFLIVIAWWLFRNTHSDIPAEQLKAVYAGSDSKFVAVYGMQAHCRITGEGDPVVLLHDAQSSLHTWDGWIDTLRPHYKVVCVDLPGFGLTGPHPRGSYSAFMYAEFLDSLAEKLGLERFHLAGNGLGAQIAWQYASEKPQKVNKLILMNAPGFEEKSKTPMDYLSSTPVVNRLLWRITPESGIRIFLEKIYADDKEVTDTLVKRHFDLLLHPGNRKAYTDRASVKDNRPPVMSFIREIKAPTLIVWGAEDAVISPEHAYQFHQNIPGSALRIYPNTGHWPQEENPERTASEARAFLEGRF
ncbi:MAG: alpha/beta fold hydrolase [Bacteroidota bacterium]